MSNLPTERPRVSSESERERLLDLLRKSPERQLSNLSPDEQRVWLLQMLDPAVPLHVFGAAEVRGTLRPDDLQRAAAVVVRRHQSLRSAFVSLGRGPVRIPSAVAAVPVRAVTAQDGADDAYLRDVQQTAEEDARRPFDLRTAPLVRLSVVTAGRHRHTVLVTMHQIVADVFSPALFIREWLDQHHAIVTGAPAAAQAASSARVRLAAPALLSPEEVAGRLEYWRAYLEGASPLDLPTDHPRPPVRSHRGADIAFELRDDLLARLQNVAASRAVAMPAVILPAFQMLLAWYSGSDEVTVGVPVDTERGDAPAIGPLARTAIVRAKFPADPDLHGTIDAASHALAEAVEHALPLAVLVDALEPARDLSRTPLFQAAFVAHSTPERRRVGRLEVVPAHVHAGVSTYDLSLTMRLDGRESMHLSLEYNTDLFRATTMQQMLRDLRRILDGIAAPSPRRLSQALADTDGPRQHETLPGAARAIDACVHELVLAQARRTPDAVALCAGAVHVTYGALARDAGRIAAFLRARGVRPESIVGVCVEHGPDAVTAILGVLESGGACVPLDPHLPGDRLAFIARDAGARLVLTTGRERVALPVPAATLDEARAASDAASGETRRPVPENLAYAIYTSGSTGQPKGVAVPHRSIVNNLQWRQRTWPLTATDRVLQNYSFSFDPSMWATWWPLLTGACVVLPGPTGHFDSRALARLIAAERVTVYGAAPSLHSVLLEEPAIEQCDSLRYVFSGGEALDGPLQALVERRLRATLCNMYGPTEATIDCSFWICPRVPEPSAAPIGRPIANATMYVLNRHHAIGPDGAPGEIHVGGLALARGYLGDPALTAQKFVPDPFGGHGARAYRTGDLGRYRRSHGFEFIGRADHQVKVRGFRIELGEIERTLALHPAVREAVAIVGKRASAEASLVAYVARRPDAAPPPAAELTSFVEERLPRYMLPDHFVVLDALPRTTSGKVDRQALPDPADATAPAASAFRPPRDTLEREIARIVGDVLGRESISIDADLFDLGCNSLLIARVASRLSNAYRVELPVQHMFRDATIAGIAALVESYQRDGGEALTAPWTLSQLEAEAALDPDITADGLPPYTPAAARRVLLTGATGYLGAFILERLLEDTDVACECLVRATSEAEGVERIRAVMEQYRIWKPEYAARIQPVPGDVAKERLGLGAAAFDRLARDVDAIYHCAALVNFVYPYSALRGPNVLGSRELLRLACRTRIKPVHYVSTVDVLLGSHMERPFLETGDVLAHPREVPDGYARSKWVAEKMLEHARARGIPSCVYRPGLIMGHTATGATQTNDYLLIGLKGYIDLGVLPEPLILIDFVTVDFVARAIAHLSRQPASLGKYFHIWNPRTVHMARAYEWIRSFGYDLDVVPNGVLRDKVLKEVDISNALYPFVPIFRAMREVSGPLPPHHPSILGAIDIMDECANTFAGLEGSGIECPPLSEELAHLCFQYLVSIGFLPEPAARAAAFA